MNGSSRTRPLFTHRIATLFLLTFVGSVGLGQGSASADPNQGVLLDGSTDASAVFCVAFTDNGLQFSIVIPPVPCPGADHVPQAGVFQASPPLAAVFHSGQFDGRGFVVSPPFVAKTLPVSLQDLWDDCDVVEQFSGVLAYLDQAYLEGVDLVSDVDDCVQDARAAYCRLVEAIENAEIHPEGHNNVVVAEMVDGQLGPIYGGSESRECVEFLVILESIPQGLDSMEQNLSTCEMKVSEMNTKAAGILNETILLPNREEHLAGADKKMSQAEEQSTQANELLNEISELNAQIGLPDVALSCEECEQSPREDPLIPLSGAVMLQTDRTPLDRYVTAFQQAARDTPDPDLAQRLTDIALRLEEIPDGRVHHLTFASTSVIGQDYLALHPADAPDDRVSPLAVLLTAVNPDPPLPPMNAADERLLFDGFQAFLVRVGCTSPGCIEDIPTASEWGLVVMTMLLLLTGIRIMLNRRQPEHG